MLDGKACYNTQRIWQIFLVRIESQLVLLNSSKFVLFIVQYSHIHVILANRPRFYSIVPYPTLPCKCPTFSFNEKDDPWPGPYCRIFWLHCTLDFGSGGTGRYSGGLAAWHILWKNIPFIIMAVKFLIVINNALWFLAFLACRSTFSMS